MCCDDGGDGVPHNADGADENIKRSTLRRLTTFCIIFSVTYVWTC